MGSSSLTRNKNWMRPSADGQSLTFTGPSGGLQPFLCMLEGQHSRAQSVRFLESIGGNFMTQVIKDWKVLC